MHVWKQWKQFQNGRQKNVQKESPLTGSYSQAFLSLDSFEKFSLPKPKVSRRITFKTKAGGGRKFNKQLKKNFLEPDFIFNTPLLKSQHSSVVSLQDKTGHRRGWDSNPRVQSTLDQQSNALTTRPPRLHCAIMSCFLPALFQQSCPGCKDLFLGANGINVTSVIARAFAEKIVLKIHAKCNSVCVQSVFTHVASIYANVLEQKESVCTRTEFNSHRTRLGHQHGRRFIVLGHQQGRRDVM